MKIVAVFLAVAIFLAAFEVGHSVVCSLTRCGADECCVYGIVCKPIPKKGDKCNTGLLGRLTLCACPDGLTCQAGGTCE